MLQAPKYHFTIDHQEDLLANVDVWEPARDGVFEKGHLHSYYEILVFLKGGGTHQMANEIFDVEDYSIHVLTNNTFHELKRTTETDGFEIIFSDVFLNQLQQFDTKTNYVQYFLQSHVLNLKKDEFKEFQVYFTDLINNKNNKSFFYNLVSIILLKLISRGGMENKVTSNIPFERALLTLLNNHYKERQTVEFYASKLNMSLNTFQRHTKSAFGKSIIDLQNEKIIQAVKFSVSQKEKSIKEISFDFNFTNLSHFTHFFKKHIGVSPSAYKKSSLS
ncbi:MAG: helix-turn-helix transcriptional regulator [Fimbriimonadaceae bacterium]|nr:helix-turn-helix transcriptional regulator [Chitinophagales bacterium]